MKLLKVKMKENLSKYLELRLVNMKTLRDWRVWASVEVEVVELKEDKRNKLNLIRYVEP